MKRFTSTYENKVDKKGRVSVPASFRAVLDDQGNGIFYLKRNADEGAIDGLTEAFMDDVQERIDALPVGSVERDMAEDEYFANSVEMRCDPDGRIILSKALMDMAGITDAALFVGKGRNRFQIWSPATYKGRSERRAAEHGPVVLARPGS
ncbi:MAG: cell division protein MraZ [Azospirillaceae bacterium]